MFYTLVNDDEVDDYDEDDNTSLIEHHIVL